MRICFVVADVRDQQATYAGVYLAVAAHRRGHDVRFVSVDDLSFLDDNTVLAATRRVRARRLLAPGRLRARARRPTRRWSRRTTWAASTSSSCATTRCARRRATATGAPLIDFGWRLRLAGTLVVNDPEGLRRAGSRMYLAEFPDGDPREDLRVALARALKEFLRGSTGRRC